MAMLHRVGIILLICVLAGFISPVDMLRNNQWYIPKGFYFTAESVYSMRASLNDSLYDVVMYFDNEYDLFSGGMQNFWNPPTVLLYNYDYWKLYLEPTACLGVRGPLGPYGPLSTWGPVGREVWNPSMLLNNITSSCEWCQQMYDWMETWINYNSTDPHGPYGPLGYMGPLTPEQVYDVMYHLNEVPWQANDFPQALDSTGPFALLGPLGPLGAMAFLGPLGPIGGLNFTTDDPQTGQWDGQFRDAQGRVVRQLSVEFDPSDPEGGTWRRYDLYEFYPLSTPLSLLGLNGCNTSWGTQGDLQPQKNSKETGEKEKEKEIESGSRRHRNSIQLNKDLDQWDSSSSSPSISSSSSSSVSSSFVTKGQPITLGFTSPYDQIVMVLVVPVTKNAPGNFTGGFSDFDLDISKAVPSSSFSSSSSSGIKWVPIISSHLKTSHFIKPQGGEDDIQGYVEFAVLQASKGDQFQVTVSGDIIPQQNRFRLFVTGTGFLQGPQGQETDMNVFNHLNFNGTQSYTHNYCKIGTSVCK